MTKKESYKSRLNAEYDYNRIWDIERRIKEIEIERNSLLEEYKKLITEYKRLIRTK